MDAKKLKERFLGVVVTLVTMLTAFYFGSFASKSQMNLIASDLDHFKKDMSTNYVKQAELKTLESKIDTLRAALCIMDDRTCKISTK